MRLISARKIFARMQIKRAIEWRAPSDVRELARDRKDPLSLSIRANGGAFLAVRSLHFRRPAAGQGKGKV